MRVAPPSSCPLLYGRYNDLKTGRVNAIDGETAFAGAFRGKAISDSLRG